MATSAAVNGDFEGCARPSQPTIGIAAAHPDRSEARSAVAATRRGNPPGRGETQACLVRMSELYSASTVLTLDSDFSIYRRNGRRVIPLSAPRSN